MTHQLQGVPEMIPSQSTGQRRRSIIVGAMVAAVIVASLAAESETSGTRDRLLAERSDDPAPPVRGSFHPIDMPALHAAAEWRIVAHGGHEVLLSAEEERAFLALIATSGPTPLPDPQTESDDDRQDVLQPPTMTASPVPTPTATPSPVPTATATPAPTATATPVPVAVSAPTGAGIWISSSQLMSKPMSGAAWDAIAAQRLVGTGANLADQNSNHDVQTLGAALYAARTGDAATRARVIAALESAIGTEKGARWLAIGRNLGAYALAADLMGIHSGPIHNWLASFNTIKLAHNNNGTPITFRQSAWGSGSNASAQEGFAHAALNAYLGNRAELDWSWNAFRRYVGDRSSPHKISSNSDSWQQIPSDPVGIQNKGATKNGIRLDGAISNDMSRGGDFKWPPGYTAYPWVGLEGAVPAAVIFERAGYRAFAHQDAALGRAAAYLWFLRVETGDANWYDASRAKDIKHLLNAFYSLNYPAASPAGAGRTVGYTDWTHGR
jgi:hypothetical protein